MKIIFPYLMDPHHPVSAGFYEFLQDVFEIWDYPTFRPCICFTLTCRYLRLYLFEWKEIQ